MAAGLLPSRLLPRRNECADARRLRSKLWAATVLSQSLGSWCTKWSNEKAEPPPTRGVNRDSGTASANGGWLRRLIRQQFHNVSVTNHRDGLKNPWNVKWCLYLTRPSSRCAERACPSTWSLSRY